MFEPGEYNTVAIRQKKASAAQARIEGGRWRMLKFENIIVTQRLVA